jgi:NAD(P)-dependent dehydrogenase (short-subunit alcohol dehydrogenase family)
VRRGWTAAALAGGGVLAAAAVRRGLRRRRRIDFAGRVVLLTGGSRGLGLAMARQLAEQGARLALVARDEDELASAAGELSGRGAEVVTIAADLSASGEPERAVRETVEAFGALDVLINNAGVIQVGPLETTTLADFETAMAVHFRAPLHLTMAALPCLERSRGGGRVVNVASIGGRLAVPHLAPYCASKFALVGLSDALAVELAPRGIGVTTVCPGLMRTGSYLHAEFKGRRRRELEWFALSSSLPLLTMDAERAARRILAACREGRPSLTLTPQARAIEVAARLAPSLTSRAAALAARLLPSPPAEGGIEPVPGHRLAAPRYPRVLLAAGRRAARRHGETVSATPADPSTPHRVITPVKGEDLR